MKKETKGIFNYFDRKNICWYKYGYCKNIRDYGPLKSPEYVCHLENQDLVTINLENKKKCPYFCKDKIKAIHLIKKLRKEKQEK